MNETELKPCPFCGGKAEIRQKSNGYGAGIFTADFEVGCVNCHFSFRYTTKLRLVNGEPIVDEDGYKYCVMKWNGRAYEREQTQCKE